jgi:hypothetical protein
LPVRPHGVQQGHLAPGGFQVDLVAPEGDPWASLGGVGRLQDDPAGQLHHVPVVLEGGVGLQHGELGVVGGVDALVAEHPAQLEDPVDPADQQPLQVQLAGDPQVQVGVEGVVVGDERPRQRPAGDGVEDRRLHLEEAAVQHRRAQRPHHPGAQPHGPAGGRVDDQVELALARADLDVGQAVPLVGQGPQRLAEQEHLGRLDRQLALPGLDHRSLDADQVAGVEVGHHPELLLAEGADGEHDLQLVAVVAQRPEDQPAHLPLEHDPAGDPDDVAGLLPGGQPVPAPADLRQGVAAAEADRERVDAGRAQLGQLVAADPLDGGAVLWLWQGGAAPLVTACRADRRMLPEEPPRSVAGQR